MFGLWKNKEKMKNRIIIVLCFLTGLNLYLNIRLAAHSELIVKNYLIGLYQQQECNQDVVLNNRLPIIERILKLPWVNLNPGVLDTTKCDAAKSQWELYELKRKEYLHFVNPFLI